LVDALRPSFYAPVFIGMNAASGLTLHPCLPIMGAMTIRRGEVAAIKVFVHFSENKL
jgi:hypothetical protein